MEQKFNELLKKIEAAKKEGAVDLTLDEDLSIAVMNLVSIEEHFFFTAEKTGKTEYFDLLTETREMRKELMKKLIGENPEGEVWCLSKHLLAATMRLIEVGSKARASAKGGFTLGGKGGKEESEDFFAKAYKLYSLFWAINLKVVDISGIKKIEEGAINKEDASKDGASAQFDELLKKLLDCCHE